MNLLYSVITGITDDKNVKISSKRVISFLLVTTLIVISCAHTFYGKCITEYVFNGLVECTIWSIAFVSSEYLTKGIPNLLRGSRTTPPIEPINMDV